jgi:hypothetical protein
MPDPLKEDVQLPGKHHRIDILVEAVETMECQGEFESCFHLGPADFGIPVGTVVITLA